MNLQNTPETDLCRLAFVILVLPLIGFLIQVFFGKRIPPRERQGDWIPTAFIFGSFLIACYMVFHLLSSAHGIEAQRWYPELGRDWINAGGAVEGAAGGFRMSFGIL